MLQCLAGRSRRADLNLMQERGGTSDPWYAEGEQQHCDDEDQQCDDAAYDCEEAGKGGEGERQGNHWELDSEREDVCR